MLDYILLNTHNYQNTKENNGDSMGNIKLGEILIQCGNITISQLDRALRIQKDKGDLIGDILVELGFIENQDLVDALKKQNE